MGLLTTKRAASLLAAGAGVLALGALPGSASAACTDIEGTGATFQVLAHTRAWIPNFAACAGDVTYVGIGSGPGMNRWKADGSGGAPSGDEFIGTDDPPSAAQINAIKAAAGGSSVEVIPVAQGAVSVIVNLPENCSATRSPLRATASSVVEAYDAGTADFGELFPGQVTGAGCAADATPIARSSGSGTTQVFKRYLSAVGGWSGNTRSDTTWPTAAVRTIGSGGPGVVTSVQGTEGSIGYVVIADAVDASLSNDASTSTFWVELPNGSGYADPAVDDGISPPTSNCANTVYSGTVPTDTTDADWTGVNGVNTSATDYPICALTYVLAYSSAYAGAPSVSGRTFTADQGQTTCRYLSYVTDDATGQSEINAHHYSALPGGAGSIQVTAEAGARSVNGGSC